MSFKLIPPFKKHPTPIVNIPMEDDVMGRADKSGNILINTSLKDPELILETINHEETHIKQYMNGELDYDEQAIYFKGKKYLRSSFDEGDQTLPWEQPAYKNE
jgi:hypothetical protein